MHPLRIGILGSGKGSNGRAILEAIRAGQLQAEARLIVSDVPFAGILELGPEFHVPTRHLLPGKFRTKLEQAQEEELVGMLRDAKVELVVLAGFMRVLKEPTLKAFPRRIVNIHPSLLPRYPGVESWRQALAAGESVAGCTVHYVDSGIDTGAIIAQREVPILPDDTPETLQARIQTAEHALYPLVLGELAAARGG